MTDVDAPSGLTTLVTGGAGFVGSHVADALVADNEVRVLDDLSTGRPGNVPDGATLVEGDVRDPNDLGAAMEGVDLVFHEAGLVSVPDSVERPAESHDRNATATVRLLEAARRADARAVLASSVAIYGEPESVPVAEDHPKEPASPYALDKLALDHYARLYNDLYGLETVALRYFNVYGPGQASGPYSGVIRAFLDQARSGGPLTVEGDGEQTRDFVHVSDVVDANLAAARTDDVGTAVNVGTGESVTIRELAGTVRDVTGADVDVVHTDPRPGDLRRSRADLSRAREVLGYEPTVSLRDGLAALVESERTGTADASAGR
ncbi:NAD-dependent epimerase/dehydratase family protein [Halorarum salinum]|uniref:NAD-dependent epimerase/dehydratase family protein n=1 Tax=Halorarum salinum TaxID=2743089 RepID=A0A7D5QJZ3_9EURY|nr:NAD-dependent epimerase/dehydratase family protein [Halobaculum salinum]QLG64322.1 NAD-dependent epimerase/dehydratase family protein [Halobaculum salinum]